MSRNRLPRVMKHSCPTGRRNHGRHLKGLLDKWDRNGSTSGPTPWQIYDDDDDDDNDWSDITVIVSIGVVSDVLVTAGWLWKLFEFVKCLCYPVQLPAVTFEILTVVIHKAYYLVGCDTMCF